MPATSAPIRPSSVARPVAVTTPRPVPAAIVGAHVDHVRAIGERRLVADCFGVLGDRQRFAGERGFRRTEVGGVEEPCVGCNGMPGRELDDVARNNVPDVDDHATAAADDDRARDAELQERFHRPPRAQLGDEADDRVEKQDGDDGRRVDVVAHGKRDDRGGGEQQNDDAGQLIAENMPGGSGLRAFEAIGANLDETPGRLFI